MKTMIHSRVVYVIDLFGISVQRNVFLCHLSILKKCLCFFHCDYEDSLIVLACLQFSSFGKDTQPEHAREDSGLEMDSPESRFVCLVTVNCRVIFIDKNKNICI